MTVLLLARHGETDWNREGRWQGHADPPLNATGRAQAAALAEELAAVPLAAVYSSDLVRARETAEAVAAAHGLPVVADPALREVDVGEWSGLTTREIGELYPLRLARHEGGGDGWEGGETHAAMSERVVAAAGRIAGAHPAGEVLLVMHGGTIRALLARAEGMPLDLYRTIHPGPVNGSVARIAVEDGGWRRID